MATTQRKPVFINSSGIFQQFSQTGGSEDVLAVVNGGTGAADAATARTNLGAQASSSNLTSISSLGSVANLTALANLVGTGISVHTGAGTYAERTIQGTSGRVTLTNGNGVSGDPTIDLATVSNGGGGSFQKLTVDSYGRVSGTSAVALADISGLVDSRYLQLSGGTLTNFLTLHADPSSAMHAATKQYVDAVSAAGVYWKTSVRAATTANVTLAGSAPNVIDGVTLAVNDRVLVKDQSTASQNGIYVVTTVGTGANGTWTRSADFDTTNEAVTGATFWVNEGTIAADTAFTLITNAPITLNTTGLTFSQTGGVTSILAGNGLIKNGAVIDLNISGDFTISSDQLVLANKGEGAKANGAYKVTIDAQGRVTATTALTAGDISAQPADATLTALSNLDTSAGILVQTGTDTFAKRTVTSSSSTLTVTNSAGTAGNINIEQTSGVVTPGTYYSVTVDTYGRVTGGSGTSAAQAITTSLTNAEAGTVVIASVVYPFSAGSVKKAIASSITTSRAIGFATSDINAAASGQIATAGVVTATTGQWDAVSGQTGGLTSNATYYVDNTTAGKITTTVPSSGFIVPVGIALSSTQLQINIGYPIQL